MNTTSMSPITDLRTLQERIGGEPHPAIPHKILEQIDERARAFIAQSPFVMLSTSDDTGSPDVSPKGDEPGFVWVEDPTSLWVPDRPGNKLIMGFRNLLSNPRAALLFVIPGTEETLRVTGRATIHDNPEVLARLAARGKPALLAMHLEVEQCFFHCAKAFKRSRLWQPDSWPEKFRVSFGDILAPKLGIGDDGARDIDALVEQDYKENL